MKTKITKRLTITVVALAMMALALPVSATPGAGVFQGGTATVTPTNGQAGLGLPIVADAHALWSFGQPTPVSGTVVGPGALPGTATIEADGELFGACGLSTGVGSGTYTINGTEIHSFGVAWPQSAGSILPTHGAYYGHGEGRIVAAVQASANPFPTGTLTSCVGSAGNTFNVNILTTTVGT